MRSPAADLLADLAAGLSELDVEWYLFGARAAILHGVARLTADVDVTVRLPARVSTDMLAQGLERRGFSLRFTEPTFLAHTRVLPFVHAPTGLPLDVVLAGPGLEDQFFERRQAHDIDGVHVPVASAEDIVVMKVLAGRLKDLEDIRAIAAAHGKSLDLGYIRSLLVTLEEALGQSDLRPVFEQAVTGKRPR
jgi:hypothetical protein